MRGGFFFVDTAAAVVVALGLSNGEMHDDSEAVYA